MKFRTMIASTFLFTLVIPANAQGIPGGVAHGVYEGNRASEL